VAVPWLMVTRDAWRLRSMIGDYEAIYGEARLPETVGPWPEHLQVLHDDLVAVGGGFHVGYYLLGPVVFLWLGWLWLVAISFIDGAITGVRRWLVLAGGIAVVADLVLFMHALVTYGMITE
jgi:hypothetical protein